MKIDVKKAWKNIEILPESALEEFPLQEQPVKNDTGINVLVDLVHQTNFTTMWQMRDTLNENGYRYTSTHACLNTALTPGKESCIRTYAGESDNGRTIRLFSKWKNPEYNVIVTMQRNLTGFDYLDEEISALESFVSNGGGLMVFADIPRANEVDISNFGVWPIRKMLKVFDADMVIDKECIEGQYMFGIAPGNDWEVLRAGESGNPVLCRRQFGKGYIILASSTVLMMKAVHFDKKLTDEELNARTQLFLESLEWVSRGKKPVGGTTALPTSYGGSGSIYPENEIRFGKFVVFYPSNMPTKFLAMVKEECGKIKEIVNQWIPSPESEEPMVIVLASGPGGGWAVNVYYPRENGLSITTREGFISLFGHEIAHTMSGPVNDNGKVAGNWFDGNQGEAHAGYFQGKIDAFYAETPLESLRECNKIFEQETESGLIDLSEIRGGKSWPKLWYIWQKFEEIYGTTWYARWRWVQYTRWADSPEKQLTMEEMIEDMSIAAGEDLFRFFKQIGTTLRKERFESAEFNGHIINLPVADIEYTPLTKIYLEPAGNYKKELT